MISPGNLLFAAEVLREQLEFRPGDELLPSLPLCHIAEQMASIHGPSVNGYCIACCERLEELPEALREVAPPSSWASRASGRRSSRAWKSACRKRRPANRRSSVGPRRP